jgi:excisionase family DNA binding protein
MPSPAPDLSEWLPLRHASMLTGRSVRSLQRAVAAGELQSAERPRSGKRPETVLHPADVERLMQARAPEPLALAKSNGGLAFGQAASPLVPFPEQEQQGFPFALSAALAAATLASHLRAQMPLWLPLDQAAAYAGLSVRLLRQLAQSGAIPSLRDGRRLKFRRADLDNWQVCPHQLTPLKSSTFTPSGKSSEQLTKPPKTRKSQ